MKAKHVELENEGLTICELLNLLINFFWKEKREE